MKRIENKKKALMILMVGVCILISVLLLSSNPMNIKLSFFPIKTLKNETLMPGQIPVSTTIPSTLSSKEECANPPKQIVVQWKHMFWFSCKLGWKWICFWPLGRSHVTYKVTLNEGTPLLDEKGKAIPIAKGKVRNWIVYNAEEWNAIENRPREKKRYPGYEKIALNEYVVMVQTRYRLFNDVESTLRICVQEP